MSISGQEQLFGGILSHPERLKGGGGGGQGEFTELGKGQTSDDLVNNNDNGFGNGNSRRRYVNNTRFNVSLYNIHIILI